MPRAKAALAGPHTVNNSDYCAAAAFVVQRVGFCFCKCQRLLVCEAEDEPCAFCHVLQQLPQLFDAKSSARVNRTRRETQRAQSVCPFVVASCDAILLQFRCIFRRLVVTDDVP
jgi:hypothetical protein